jgi:hypothetical protein
MQLQYYYTVITTDRSTGPVEYYVCVTEIFCFCFPFKFTGLAGKVCRADLH